MQKGQYHGTYPIRVISKREKIIHMPDSITGEFAIYEQEDSNLTLVKVGEKKKPQQ